ncbi:hypothetical protein CCACVL1_23996 [Corchorus capsularis]|uniref:Uncharacterized protein n=1 Tax=Corchorus capsularis TaxID=210143 RepID=A0A1R3GRL1_COCAP|nr:hypothetical protein CCACVL1_23996 [Corchorus capsularis]
MAPAAPSLPPHMPPSHIIFKKATITL